MGREIRRVIPGWEHPMEERNGRRDFKPMRDTSFTERAAEWKAGFAEWEGGKKEEGFETYEYWEYHDDPPDREYYRPDWKPEQMTWFQMYETVSEGTPVSPPFATAEELIDYLVANGDFWDQKRGNGGWDRKNAEAFVKAGWAPSMMVQTGPGGFIKEPRDGIV